MIRRWWNRLLTALAQRIAAEVRADLHEEIQCLRDDLAVAVGVGRFPSSRAPRQFTHEVRQ